MVFEDVVIFCIPFAWLRNGGSNLKSVGCGWFARLDEPTPPILNDDPNLSKEVREETRFKSKRADLVLRHMKLIGIHWTTCCLLEAPKDYRQLKSEAAIDSIESFFNSPSTEEPPTTSNPRHDTCVSIKMNVFKICAVALFATVGLASVDAALCQNDKTLEVNKALVTTALNAFFNKHDASAVDKYVSSTYLQHNPYVQDGPDQLKALVTSLEGTDSSYEIGAVAAEGDLVWTHSRSPAGNASVIVDVFRVKDGKLEEHWDITQPETPASETASGNPMFPIVPTTPVRAKGCASGANPCQLKEELEVNKALAAAALDAFFNQKDPSAVDKYISEPYLNHNPFARNGAESLKGLISGLAPEVTFEMGAQVAEDDLVWTSGRYNYGNGVAFIVADVFRVRDGKLVEHWDISQMEVADTASGRPMFPITE
ncbi:hypothetical protein FI667_g8634, partial [Globisporangium splendens]